MKKTTPKHLTKRLTQYGALTAAIAGVVDANSQGIVYTSVDVGAPGLNYPLDLNNDAINDFIFDHIDFGSNGVLRVKPTMGNSIIASVGMYTTSSGAVYSFNYPLALDNNQIISTGNSLWNSYSNYQFLNFSSCADPGSNWCGVVDKYLGLRFKISGNTHYGWAQLDVDLSTLNWKLKGYAYNTTPDESINAGQQTLDLKGLIFSKVKVVALNKSIALYNLPQSIDYKLYNLMGQSVLVGNTNQDTYVIEANTISSGIYILEIQDVESKSVFKKKLVL